MSKGRMEAFSDGVIAIIITVMVLEFHTPPTADLEGLRHLLPTFLSYVLSFVFIGIYWSNHHHLLQAVHKVNGGILWANLHLLFWLSLTPFVTAWMGNTGFAQLPVSAYGVVLLGSAIAYYILVRTLIAHHGSDSQIAVAVGSDFKGRISIVIYLVAIAVAFWVPLVSDALYICVALMWLVPDRRIEHELSHPKA